MTTTTLKPRRFARRALLALLASLATACAAESDVDTQAAPDAVGTSEEELVASSIFITRQSLTFDACTALLTLRFRTLGTGLGFIAFDAVQASDLALELFTVGATGALTPLIGITAVPLDAALLTSVRADVAAAAAAANVTLGTSLVLTDAQVALIAAQLQAQTLASMTTLLSLSTTTLNVAMRSAAIRFVLDPAVTASTLLVPNLTTLPLGTSIAVRARFAGSAFALSRVNVLAATSLGLVRRTFFDVPFVGFSCLGIIPIVAIPPVVVPPILPPVIPPILNACGPSFCGPGEFCCNPSCGICAPVGGVCIQIACE